MPCKEILKPRVAKDRISPCNINTISSRKVMRLKKNIKYGIIRRSRFSKLTSPELHGTHKVYLLMKNCIQTTREHYFSNLISIWHVSQITRSSSWRKQRWFTFRNIFIPLRLSSWQDFKLGIKLKYIVYRMRSFTKVYGTSNRI